MTNRKLFGLLEGGRKGLFEMTRRPFWASYRRRAAVNLIDGVFEQLATLTRHQPYAQAHRHHLELISDVPYRNSGDRCHTLDIYRPTQQPGPWPIVLYVHGGAFRILSKDTHWMMAHAFAREGFLVFNINYRLAPKHPFPAALEDACDAYRWVVRNAAAFGGDLDRLVLAGESAGANLITGLAIASSFERQEPWAREVFQTGVQPAAVVPACGFLQVSDAQRFARAKAASPLVAEYLAIVEECYLGSEALAQNAADRALADPLLILEGPEQPQRPLPAFFAPVGTSDPVLDDTRRLEMALVARGAEVEARYYEGERHAFHAFLWRRQARLCWRQTFDFLNYRFGQKVEGQPAELRKVAGGRG